MIVESVLVENLIHREQILSQDVLPIFPWAGYVAGDKHLNPEPHESEQSECDERAFLPHVAVLNVCAASIAERLAHCELASCLTKTGVLTTLRRLFAFSQVSERNGDFSPIDKLGRPLDNFPLADDPLRQRYRTALAKI